ncbi:MAG TPA: hypothetical protein VM056_06855 [Terriglobales bacterium]|nr:hypothetical protein [Terriglobales bacterium]
MSKSRAIREGFTSVFRDPLIYVAELAWHWTYGIAAALLTIYAVLLFLNSLPVSDRDLFGLSGIIPGLYAEALANIFRGSGPKMVRTLLFLAIGLGMLWFLAASFGRVATLTAMMRKKNPRIRPVLRLHFLRLMVGAMALVAYMGALAVAASAAKFENGSGYHVGKFYLVFLIFSFVIGSAWSSASWYLSLGPLLSIRNETGTLDSLYDVAALVRRRPSQFTWVGIFYGIVRATVWFFAFFIFLAVMGSVMQAPPGIATGVFILLVASFSAVSNLINILRLSSYSRVVQWDEDERLRPQAPPVPQVIAPPLPLLDPPIVPAM